MKATAMRRYHCVCTECDPLPPLEGLHPETFGETGNPSEPERKLSGLFQSLAERIIPVRRSS